MTHDEKYIQRTFDLARKGIGKVNPNPLVGALIVRDDTVIGEGFHAHFGGPHAEINAIADAEEDVAGSTVYVSLEPCSFYGKTPPCAEELIKRKVGKVVISMKDPNPRVRGEGVRMLREAGIEVVENILTEKALELNKVFVKFISTGLPYVVMKYAMTLDGKIATYKGHSRWISEEPARKRVHELRNELRGIMAGVNTVKVDNPLLNCRMEGAKRDPVRIILDPNAEIPNDSLIMQTAAEQWTIIVTADNLSYERKEEIKEHGAEVMQVPAKAGMLDLKAVMAELGRLDIDGILLEGGSTLNYSMLKTGLVDEVIAFISSKFIGGELAKSPVGGTGVEHMDQAFQLERMEYEAVGDDLMINGKIKH